MSSCAQRQAQQHIYSNGTLDSALLSVAVNSPEWHSLYLPNDVATLQLDRHFGTYPPSDLMLSPSRASRSQSYPNARPTVATCRASAPGYAPGPASHGLGQRYPAQSVGDSVRPLGVWAIAPADSLATGHCFGSATTTRPTTKITITTAV